MPKKPKPHGNAKYDWAEIEARYVASDITLDRLCEIYGCTMSTIGPIASAKGWTQKRAEYRDFVASESIEKIKSAVLFDKLQFDAMTERVTDLAVAVVAEKFTKEYQHFKAGNRSEIEALEMREMMAVVKQAQDVKYRALNIAPPKQQIAIERVQSPAEDLIATMRESLDEFDSMIAGDIDEDLAAEDAPDSDAINVKLNGNGNGQPG